MIAKGQADFESVLSHTLELFQKKFEYFRENVGGMDELFEASFSSVAESGRPISRCGKCRRFMKYIAAKPHRLYCMHCDETYSLPPGGTIKLYKELKCPLDEFELLLYSGGPKGQRQAIEEKMKQQERRDDEERREGLEGERIQQKASTTSRPAEEHEANSSSDVLAIVKKVCVTCPCCEARIRSLPVKLEEVEKKLDEFVARVEEKFSDLKGSSLPAQRICSPDIDVDKAVKDAVSAINNRDHVILYGLPETGSAIKDFDTVKDIFDSLGVNDVKAMDVFRLGKVQSVVGVSQSKPRLLKVRLSSSIVRNSLLKKAKLLRDSSKYKSVFIRRSYSFVERSKIKELYNVLRQKKDETGREFFIDRRGNVGTWTVKERTTGSTATSGIGNTQSAQPASNC
eukprot:Em0018g1148a